jgi:hypothetical protein
MTNFQSEISFSKKILEKRIPKAGSLIGEKTVNRIIGLALFLLGGNREQISNFLEMPAGTFFSLLTRFRNRGVEALIDKREKKHLTLTKRKPVNETETETTETLETIGATSPCLEVVFGEQSIVITIPPENNKIIVNPSNPLQSKTLILSFMSSGFLTPKEASEFLSLSQRHVRDLSKKLETGEGDIDTLIDKRQGQQKDYVFTEEIKAELIQQYTLNVVTGRSTSSSKITSQINEACNSSVSQRAVRQHEAKLGLNKIKYSLPKLLRELKKNSEPGR